jgi:hypothetical protein
MKAPGNRRFFVLLLAFPGTVFVAPSPHRPIAPSLRRLEPVALGIRGKPFKTEAPD